MKVYCDTHVHCYDFDNFDQLLESAYKNLHHQATKDGTESEASYMLFFTDGKTDKTWNNLKNLLKDKHQRIKWSLSFDKQTQLIKASNKQRSVLLAPARQVITTERLELLLLGCDLDLIDGIPAAEVIAENQQYVVICPWGVGKWLGNRGKILSALIKQFSDKLFLGDNASRPNLWRYIPQFKESNNPIFNGSDPLPISGELARIGRFGLKFDYHETELSGSKINLSAILSQLKSSLVKKTNFGKLFPIIPFIRNQLALKNL